MSVDAPGQALPPASADRALRERLIQRITACWTTQALRVAVELGLPDRLSGEPTDVQALADACGCAPTALRRLLRALCTLEICTEQPDGRFALAPGGALLLRSEAEETHGLRALALWWGGPMWPLWADLGFSIRTGQSARARQTGQRDYGFIDGSPDLASLFHAAMRAMTQMVAADLAQLGLWAEVHELVDVGGGQGELASTIAMAHTHLRATVLDRADAGPAAQRLLHARGLTGRARFHAGDFFAEVPAADCYLLKSILHNWNDTDCHRLLSCCARAAPPGARLLIVERLRHDPLQPQARDQAVARTDLNMLIGLGGHERSPQEFDALLTAAGFVVTGTRRLPFEFDVLEARRV